MMPAAIVADSLDIHHTHIMLGNKSLCLFNRFEFHQSQTSLHHFSANCFQFTSCRKNLPAYKYLIGIDD